MIKSREISRVLAQIGRKRMRIEYRWGKQKERGPLGRPRRIWVDNIKIDLRYDVMVWTGLIWLRIETSGGLV
jgi:hypothetical protein